MLVLEWRYGALSISRTVVLLERESRDMPAHFRRSGEQVSEFSDSHTCVSVGRRGIVEGMLSVADGRTSSVGVDVEQLVFDGVLVLEEFGRDPGVILKTGQGIDCLGREYRWARSSAQRIRKTPPPSLSGWSRFQ